MQGCGATDLAGLPSLDIERPTVLNEYARLASNAVAGSNSIRLSAISDLHSTSEAYGAQALGAGDLLLLYQAQGAELLGKDSVGHGTLTKLGSAGRYEFVRVAMVNGDDVMLDIDSRGLKHDYSVGGNAQAVRVPRLSSLTVQLSGEIQARPWDGQTGGIAALWVAGELRLDGRIDASKSGFRGGASGTCDDPNTPGEFTFYGYITTNECEAGGAGEGIGGFVTEYDLMGGANGRAARINGGGGGNAPNCAGGGGANSSGILNWTGCGATSSNSAWDLDPTCQRSSVTAGGGRGGYGWSGAEQDPLTVPPGDERWAGGARAEAGGLGGRPVAIEPESRRFFGGGGGAGQNNDTDTSVGGTGGGLVFVIAGRIGGLGSIAANGDSAENETNDLIERDGQPGGGAGGSIIVVSAEVAVELEARGGSGADYEPLTIPASPDDSYGGGGGGGGGVILTSAGPVLADVSGGRAGVSTHQFNLDFPENGSTAGAPGLQETIAECRESSLCESVGCPSP